MIAVALLALSLAGELPPLPADWTTNDGNTYHHVRQISRNNLEVNIQSDEGKMTLQLADLPTDIQTHYGYDALMEAAMNAYLNRLRVESSVDEVRIYEAQVKKLLANPAPLKALSPGDLYWLQENRLLGGGYMSYKLPKAEADALIHDETELVGLIAMAMEAKANPAVDLKAPMALNDIPLEMTNQHPTPEERKTYNALVAAHQKQREAFNAEWQVRRFIEKSLQDGEYYLRVLYHHINNDNRSIEPQVRPLLTGAGIDPATIDFLLGKTTYAIR